MSDTNRLAQELFPGDIESQNWFHSWIARERAENEANRALFAKAAKQTLHDLMTTKEGKPSLPVQQTTPVDPLERNYNSLVNWVSTPEKPAQAQPEQAQTGDLLDWLFSYGSKK